jgi:hypothetical protein
MKGLRLFLMLALLTAFMAGTAMAADYYVFRNRTGQTLVLDYVPSSGWVRVDGPYTTSDAAKRAWGIGTVAGSGGKTVPTPNRAVF